MKYIYHSVHRWAHNKAHLRLKSVQLLFAVYIVIVTFSYPPIGVRNPATNSIIDVNSEQNTADGYVNMNGSQRPVVATNAWQMVCLAFSRTSAFSMYPVRSCYNLHDI